MKKSLLIASAALALSGMVQADILFTSNFDGHDVAVDPGYVKDVTGQATAAVSWTKDASVTAISGLTAVTGGGGFINQNNGLSTANTLKVNYNLNKGTKQGYYLTFTLNQAWNLDTLSVVAAHSNGTGGPQVYTSTLNYSLSGGTLGSPVTGSSVETYASAFKTVNFNLAGTTLGAGSYTLQVDMDNFTDPGAYATYDGVTLAAIPEPSTLGLVALSGGSLLLIRRKFLM